MSKSYNIDFGDGYKIASYVFSDAVGLATTDVTSTNYLSSLDNAIKTLTNEMNAKAGNNNPNLYGYTDEIWHKGTLYIDAIAKRTGESGYIPNAHQFASADFASSWGELYQLKNYRNGQASAFAQAVTYNQEYNRYLAELSKQGKPLISKEQYLIERNLDQNIDMNLPIYEAQTRLVPTDQLPDAIKALKIKIISEPREEQRLRYEDTLNKLVDRITSPDGASSIPLTREDSLNLAKLAKEGKREELEKKVDRFMNSKLYRKIKEFDERFPTGPLFIAKIKEEIKGYKYSELKPYERGRINSKALLFLILAMPTNEEKDFFENYEDLVNYLKEDGEKELADYLKKYWLSGNILDILWEIYDQED